MKYRWILLVFLLLFLAGNIVSCKNKLPVDGALEIGFPFRFIYYVYTPRHTGFHFSVDAMLTDTAIALAAAWGAVRIYFYFRKRINSA